MKIKREDMKKHRADVDGTSKYLFMDNLRLRLRHIRAARAKAIPHAAKIRRPAGEMEAAHD